MHLIARKLCFLLVASFCVWLAGLARAEAADNRLQVLAIENTEYWAGDLPRLRGTEGALEQLLDVLSSDYGAEVALLRDAEGYDMSEWLFSLADRVQPEESLLVIFYGVCLYEREHAHWLGVDGDREFIGKSGLSAASIARSLRTARARDVLLLVPGGCFSRTLLDRQPQDEMSVAERLASPSRSRRVFFTGYPTEAAQLGAPVLNALAERLSELDEFATATRVLSDVAAEFGPDHFDARPVWLEDPMSGISQSLGPIGPPDYVWPIPSAGHEAGDFVFAALDATGPSDTPQAPSDEDGLPPIPEIDLEFASIREQIAIWQAIGQSDRPEEFAAYLEAYPDGVFAHFAEQRLAELSGAFRTGAGPPTAAPEPLKQGDRGEEVRRIQEALVELGFDPRGTDGIWGPGTSAAVASWQKLNGYEETPSLSPEMIEELMSQTAPQAVAKRPVGEVFRDCPECPEMMVIPPGRYERIEDGASFPSDRTKQDVVPQTGIGARRGSTVTIRTPPAIGRFEVTFRQWDACVAAGGCFGYRPDDEGWGRGDRPVVNVSHADAQAYVLWLSRETGQRYRLPSETEWEHAARAGTSSPYWWGWTASPKQAHFGDKNGTSVPVGSFEPNPFGLHDTQGNVWEMVEDCWDPDYLNGPSDGRVRAVADCRRIVIRGGSWYDGELDVSTSSRNGIRIDSRINNVGFRVAREH